MSAKTPGTSGAEKEDYWRRFQDLFTRDVTETGLRELIETDARETVAFFSRQVALEDLEGLPLYKRWPIAAFRLFEAMAYRLSPARRLLFAAAVLVLMGGWVQFLISAFRRSEGFRLLSFGVPSLLLIAATLLVALLMLELRDKLSLKGDLEIARQIQFGLVPREAVTLGPLRLRGAMRPANTVGGDYFDIVGLEPGRLALVMADVAGKGMPAALLMALVQGSLRTLATAGHRGSDLVTRLNDQLSANIPANRMVTLFYAEIAASDGRLYYVNAGHNPPLLLRRGGGIERLEATGIALGVLSGASFESGEAPFEAGDRLLVYTDGITEATNLDDEEYGEPRLRDFLDARRVLEARPLMDGLIQNVLSFCGPARPRDDMTLLVLDRET